MQIQGSRIEPLITRLHSAALLPTVHVLIIVLLGLVVYSNTLHAPFQWDEDKFLVKNPYITQNASIETLRYDDELYKMLKHRYIGFLTFKLNHTIHGFKVEGYHLVNITVHLINGLLVYWLCRTIFLTPALAGSTLHSRAGSIAFISALFFISHPVLTEAVTYVHQRFASLAALFYLLTLCLYGQGRLREAPAWEIAAPPSSGQSGNHVSIAWAWHVGAVLSAVLAMKTKENAFTLPLMAVLLELLFFRGPYRLRMLRLAPLLATLIIIPYTALVDMGRPWELATKTHAVLSRSQYLFTELRVIPTYLRLLVLPVDQRLLYDYPVYTTLFAAPVLLSILLILAILTGTALLYRKVAGGVNELRLVVFGLLWFFLSLSVESSVFPTPYVIAEYRLYLPSVGLFIATVSALMLLYVKAPVSGIKRLFPIFLSLTLAAYASAAYVRNSAWNDVIGFWGDVAAKSPGLDLPHIQLGAAYHRLGRYNDAVREYGEAISRDATFWETQVNLGLAQTKLGDHQAALESFLNARRLAPEAYEVHLNLGIAYRNLNMRDEALWSFDEAVRLQPHSAEARTNLGIALDEKGRVQDAVQQFREALRIDPEYFRACLDLGITLLRSGRYKEAVDPLENAVRLRSASAPARNALGMAYEESGRHDDAVREYQAALDIDPDYSAAANNLKKYRQHGIAP